ncbi:hypothetical protein T01_10335 [Trichinella spiralis]|uniref:Uncharacterized protein n=1 Tax=Trichinella spiralis TaxID=6334 RepID=A0A0V1B8W5_TRISP|nr:hypothetical protein T01_10335 [Trichinella spiralis]
MSIDLCAVASAAAALLIHNKAEAEWKHRFESFVCVFVERGAFSANESYLYSASYVSTVILSRLIKSILLLIWADIVDEEFSFEVAFCRF